jgi:hypothetical protein
LNLVHCQNFTTSSLSRLLRMDQLQDHVTVGYVNGSKDILEAADGYRRQVRQIRELRL